ncbi:MULTISPECIES: hypothetical protein [Paenibacillus]|uniref:Secreted protein n=2 Tax=Paenibacillus TaxID=44249 RepID=A0AAJ3MH84_PAEPO|nr:MULTISPECIES: hypothetical protein [Paenibacillus]AHC22567.2 hypothetical protein X809_27485 [Paenibacillus polymyxa CR1]APB78011.1 hypothetical protein PPYC2_25160 [Paenibacillus polymyxa]APQ57522.1 hypothetical protein VK72_01460 [Paenibacillus polymyxa]MCP3747345.1 hypothetical protein [Paenibacillus sp. A3M_27_13]MDH2332698.1 hypothetical protein [Paenibacillus polymyxa]
MKKFLVTMLVVMLVAIGLTPASSYADSSSSAKESSPQSFFPAYSSIANSDSLLSGLTPEEYNEVIKNAKPIESIAVEKEKTQLDQKISPMSLGAWSFSHHSRDDGAIYSNKFSVNNAAILNFHVVQWADGSSWSSPEVGYLLVNKNYLGEVFAVYGRYTDENRDFQIKAPGFGQYQVMVLNLNDYTISGNGYVTF